MRAGLGWRMHAPWSLHALRSQSHHDLRRACRPQVNLPSTSDFYVVVKQPADQEFWSQLLCIVSDSNPDVGYQYPGVRGRSAFAAQPFSCMTGHCMFHAWHGGGKGGMRPSLRDDPPGMATQALPHVRHGCSCTQARGLLLA